MRALTVDFNALVLMQKMLDGVTEGLAAHDSKRAQEELHIAQQMLHLAMGTPQWLFEAPLASGPKIYDLAIDEERAATQIDIDNLSNGVQLLTRYRQAISDLDVLVGAVLKKEIEPRRFHELTGEIRTAAHSMTKGAHK